MLDFLAPRTSFIKVNVNNLTLTMLFQEKAEKELAKSLTFHLRPFYLISVNKWYVDEIYDQCFTRPLFFLASFFWKRGDQKSIDAFGPDGISQFINFTNHFMTRNYRVRIKSSLH